MKVHGLGTIVIFAKTVLYSQLLLSNGVLSSHHAPPAPSNNTASTLAQHPTIKAPNATNSLAMPLAKGNRPVYLVMHVKLTGAQTLPPTYEKLFPAYASLHFNATSMDGPLEIQIVNDHGQDLIRVTDWGLENSDKPMGVPQLGYLTDYFELFGKSNATNNQILDAATGKGIVRDVWSRNNSLALKAYNSIDFMHACIAYLGLGLAPSNSPSSIVPTRIFQAQMFWRNIWVDEKVISHYPIRLEALKGWGDQVQKTRTEFHWQVGADPTMGMVRSHSVPLDPTSIDLNSSFPDNGMSDLAAPGMTETYQASDDAIRTAPEYQWIYSQSATRKSTQRRDEPSGSQLAVADQYLVYNPGEDDYVAIAQKLDEGTNEYAVRPADDLSSPANRPDIAAEARTASQKVLALLRPVAAIGSITSIVAIVILDLKDSGDSTSLICGLFSLIGGFLGLFLLVGPGFLSEIIMLASILIGVVPHLSDNPGTYGRQLPQYTDSHSANTHGVEYHWKRASLGPVPPLRTDIQGILQYAIIGDRNKTGNENCLSKGYKECTVVYGPHLLAAALQIEIFDAFALLVHYNEGFPMAMKDLVKAFGLSTDPDSAKQVATIDCSHSSKPNGRFSWSGETFL